MKTSATVGTQKTVDTALKLAALGLSYAAASGWVGAVKSALCRWLRREPLGQPELTGPVVQPPLQRQGIGRALVADLEARVRERGGLTIWLGSDDEDAMTSLAGVDLYPDPLAHLAAIRNYKGHPYEFYRKVGFAIAGALPDANGLGKPDIFLAKSVVRR